MISLNPLVGLVWVARHQSYAKAARAFPYPISQPGLHQQVRSLERDLDATLFTRVAKDRVVPTPIAASLVALAEPFLKQLDETLEAISRGDALTLRLHASPLVLRQVVAPRIARLRRAHHAISLQLDEIRRPDSRSVLRGNCDVLVDFVPDIAPGLDSAVVATASAYIAMEATDARAKRKRLSVSAFDGEDFLAYPTSTVHREFQDRAIREASVCVGQITEVTTAESILALVAAGCGFSLVPWIDPKPPTFRGVAFRRVGRARQFEIRAIYRGGSEDDPTVAAALKALARRGD